MKKLISLILSTALILSIVACGNNSSNSEPEMEFSNLEWPTDEIAKQIPIPKSTMAYIMNSGSAVFEFYLANTTLEDFKAYVEECKAKGFTLDAVEQENRYYAFDEEENELTVQHKDGDIMYICVKEERFSVEIKLLHKDSTSADMYNLWIEIDGFWEGDSEKGSEAITFESYLKEGKHTLMIENDDDDNINGRIDFVVSEDNEYFEFEINCLSNKIEICQATDSGTTTTTDATSVNTESTTTVTTTIDSNTESKKIYSESNCFELHAYKFANNFEDAFGGIHGHTFKTEAVVDDDKLFYDADNYIRYRIFDAENSDRNVGMIGFTKPDGNTLLVSEEFTANCWNGANILIESAEDVSATVVATVFAIDANIEYSEAFDVAQNIVDNVSIYTGDASELKRVEHNNIRYILYKDNKYHYLIVTR